VTHLVTESMTTNDNRVDPAGDWSGDPFEDDGFTKHSSPKNITDLAETETGT
jgi:hypothetical protein